MDLRPHRESDADDLRDEKIAGLLDELVAKERSGEMVDIEMEIRKHPEFADEMRELWAAVMLADAVALPSSSPSSSVGYTRDEHDDIFELPYEYGDYQLLEEIGRGGMGVVFRARQLSLGRNVAIKMLLRGQFASDNEQARLRSEAAAAAKLDHPNIVPVYDVGAHHGYAFFSMKYVAGQTLAEFVCKGPQNAKQIAGIMLSVARAIAYAHQKGILHRDLKPSNILIDETGQPHVTDFGLAKHTGESVTLTRTGAVLGTPAYMSPEQAAGNKTQIDHRSDVYSLGCILYHMLTGQSPFSATSPVDIVLQVLEEEPPLPRSINPSANRDLEMIALRCMQKPRDLRYASAERLADDLQAFLSDEPLTAHRGRATQMFARLFRETHHAAVLENWGQLWMWHSVAVVVICFLTNALYWSHFQKERWPYFLLWTAGLGGWAAVFWAMRSRRGPVTFVERQIAHLWAASMISIAMLFPIEQLMGLDVLTLSPIVSVVSGMVFLAKASILSGTFYFYALALFLTSLAMAKWPSMGHVIFGCVLAGCFFLPGWKYHRQKINNERIRESEPEFE